MTLKDAFDQEVFVIEDKEYTDEDLQAMSLDDLTTLKMLINKKISGLAAAIAEKRMDYANSGKRTSTNWTIRHRNAMSINQRVAAYINYLIRKHYKSDKKFSDYFLAAARLYLSQADYDSILAMANQEMRAEEKQNECD